jgi:hypothetical protein
MTTWKDSIHRRDDVKAAFEEGARAAMDVAREQWNNEWAEPELDADRLHRIWRESQARKLLEKPLD